MALQTFTAGQILTAAQVTALQTNDYNQTVSAKVASYTLVAADKGTRITMSSSSATTITVNTSLFTAGDSLRIQNIGTAACVVTAGTATVTSAGSLSIPQWGGGQLYFTSASAAVYFPDAANSGLTLIATQTIGTTVTAVAVSNVFSATYDTYKIVVSGGLGSLANSFAMTLGASVTGYYSNLVYTSYNTTVAGAGTSNGASWTGFGGIDTTSLNLNLELNSPFLAKNTTFQAGGYRTTIAGAANGIHQVQTSYTGFTLAPESGTITGGTIRVYGYQLS